MNVTIYVYRRPNMFNVNESMFHMLGYEELKLLFTQPGVKVDYRKLRLYYPERFLNILEQRALLRRLEHAGYEDVVITTGNEHILTTCRSEYIRIVQDQVIEETREFVPLSNPDSGMPESGMPGEGRLRHFGGEFTSMS